MGPTKTPGNVGPVTVGLTAPTPDLALAIGQVSNLDTRKDRTVSREAAVVSLAVVLCVVGATATGDVAPAPLSGGGLGHLSPIVQFLYKFVKELCYTFWRNRQKIYFPYMNSEAQGSTNSGPTQSGEKRQVFVLMPFDESFDAVYKRLICAAFEDAGFDVHRAGDIGHQQNILRDIVNGIIESAVVVADLTDSNPNVYYELGLAHALKKPVVLISQDVGGVPFDLRSYRVLEYDTRFDRFDEAKRELTSLAQQIAEGKIAFGNPVSDFGTGMGRPEQATPHEAPPVQGHNEGDHGQPGLLDSIVEVREGSRKTTAILIEMSEHLEGIWNQIEDTTPKLERMSISKDIRGARNLLRLLGKGFEEHYAGLRDSNRRLRDVWTEVANSLESMLKHPWMNKEEGREVFESVKTLAAGARTSKEGVLRLIDEMERLPAMEQLFDKSKRKIVEELRTYASNVDEMESLEGRVRSIVEDRSNGGDGTATDA